jgi:hypothetical protein
VREYLVWRTLDAQLDWFVLEADDYRVQLADTSGVIRSPHFPGLALAVEALLARDAARVLDALQAALADPAHAAFANVLNAGAPQPR